MSYFLVNGRLQESIPIADRGLNYADGLFETIAVCDGSALLADAHLARLNAGCLRLGIRANIELDLVHAELAQLLDVAGSPVRAVLKLIITRGAGGRGYRADPKTCVTRIAGIHPWPDYPHEHQETGVRLRLCATRLSRNPALAGLKTLARIEQVLARAEWGEDFEEGLMADDRGHIIEGTFSNLFVVMDDVIITPLLDEAGISGVMRNAVMASLGLRGHLVEEGVVTVEMLERASGLFVTNSLIGVWPVARFEHKTYTIPSLVRDVQEDIQHVVAH